MSRLIAALLLWLLPALAWGQGQLIPGNRTISGTFNAGLTTGTGTAYTLNLNPAITTYVPDQAFAFRAHVANTGPATLTVNLAGAKELRKWQLGVLVPLVAGDIRAQQEVEVMYDGVYMQVLSLGGQVLAIGTAGTLQAATGGGGLAGFSGFRCPVAGTFATEIQATGALICNPASTTGGTSSARALLAEPSAQLPSGINLGSQASGLVLSTVSGGIASVTTKPAPSGELLGTTQVQEVTQTRVTPRQCSQPTTVTPLVVNLDDCDVLVLTELQQATLIDNPSGSVRPSQPLRFRAHSTVPRAITWGGFWRANPGSTLPTTTTGGTTEDVWLFEYSSRLGQAILTFNSQQQPASDLPTDTTLVGTAHALMTGVGPFTPGHCVLLDAGLNLVDGGAPPCGGGGGTVAGTPGDLQYNRGGVLAADSGEVMLDPTSHTLVAANLQGSLGGSYFEFRDRLGRKGFLMPPSNMGANLGWLLPAEPGEICVKGGSGCGGTGGGAPTTATYWTSSADATLSAETNLGALTTGLLKHSVSGGVSTPATAVAGTDYTTPSGSETLGNKRVNERLTVVTSGTTFPCSIDTSDTCAMVHTGAAASLHFPAPGGTPNDGNTLLYRLRCSVPQTLTADTAFLTSVDVPFPSSCPPDASKDMFIGTKYSASLGRWQVIGVSGVPPPTTPAAPRVSTQTSAATNPSFACAFDLYDQCELKATGPTGSLTVQPPTGALANGEMRLILFQCSALQVLVFDDIFIGSPHIPLPTSCPAGVSTWFAVGVRYSASLGKFQALASN